MNEIIIYALIALTYGPLIAFSVFTAIKQLREGDDKGGDE